MTQKSKNHICWNNGMEILTGPNRKYVFMAYPDSPIECTGNRECAIFYCTVNHWNNKTEMGKTFPVVA